jgi:hypothetical protein
VSVGRNKRIAPQAQPIARRKRSDRAASSQAQPPRRPCLHVARLSPEKAQCAALIAPYVLISGAKFERVVAGLIEALASGRIGRARLDVFHAEPIKAKPSARPPR